MKSTALARIQKQFPKVTRVIDAKKPVLITVTEKDSKEAIKKDATDCALARACKRQEKADGVIIGIGISWVIKGDTAYRYITSVSVGREITSFDRHHDFAEGKNYRLSAVSPRRRLGIHKNGRKNRLKTGRKLEHKVHRTQDIRVLNTL